MIILGMKNPTQYSLGISQSKPGESLEKHHPQWGDENHTMFFWGIPLLD